MNFFLNKIDNDIRRKIYEKTRNGKVHRKENIKIYKDSEKNKEKNLNKDIDNKDKEEKETKEKNKITIRVIKVKNVDENSKIILEAEKEENINYENRGNYIDTKK